MAALMTCAFIIAPYPTRRFHSSLREPSRRDSDAGRRIVRNFLEREERPAFNLLINAAEIFADNAKAEQLHGGQEQDDGGYDRVPDQRRRGMKEAPVDDHTDHDQREKSHQKAEVSGDAKRHPGKGDDTGHRQAERFAKGVLHFSSVTSFTLEWDRGLPKTDPRSQTSQIASAFRERIQNIHNLAIHETEIAGVRRDILVCEQAQKPIKDIGEDFFRHAFPLTGNMLSVDDMKTFAPSLDHGGNQLGRIL